MPRWPRRGFLVLTVLASAGCATLQRLAQLPQLDFHIDGVSDPDLAGVDLTGLRRVEDLRPGDFLRIAAAVRARRLPLRFDLHLGVDNPSANRYDLHLERLEWTLLLEDRETVSGVFARELVIAAGGTTDVPLSVEVDLLRFFEDGAGDLAALALRAAGAGGPTNVTLRARPTVRTPFGSFRFPNEITVASRDR
jgi:hypothetical protein